MTMNEIQDRIIDEFSKLDDWLDRYERLIGEGECLPPLDEQFKTDRYALPGCQSKVWIRADVRGGLLSFEADSDSKIIKGIFAFLFKVVNGRRPREIAGADLYFIKTIGMSSALSPARAIGMASIVKHIKNMARELDRNI